MLAGDTAVNPTPDSKDVVAARTLCQKVFAGRFWNGREVFWECRPVTRETLMTTAFEFVGISAPEMYKKPTDEEAFADKFPNPHAGTIECLQFMTPSPPPKETNLLVPARAPDVELSAYRSFSSFFEGAPTPQVNNMLELLGKQVPARMAARGDPRLPLYVS